MRAEFFAALAWVSRSCVGEEREEQNAQQTSREYHNLEQFLVSILSLLERQPVESGVLDDNVDTVELVVAPSGERFDAEKRG